MSSEYSAFLKNILSTEENFSQNCENYIKKIDSNDR